MTESERRATEEYIVREMRRIAFDSPRTATPNLDFKRDWAYGNAGLENDKITREQVDETIQE